jgi:hypothetical protein
VIFSAVLTVCLISAPAECQSVEVKLREWHPMMQQLEAQTWADLWLDAHRGYVMRDLRVVRGVGA